MSLFIRYGLVMLETLIRSLHQLFYSFKLPALILLSCLIMILVSGPTFAQCAQDPNAPTDSSAVECKAAGIVQVQQLVTRMINISVTIAFMALTVWLVWSAIKLFITSGGDPKNLAHAWQSVTWAFMGIFFLILAYLVIRLVSAVTGADVDSYCFGFPPYCIDQMLPGAGT